MPFSRAESGWQRPSFGLPVTTPSASVRWAFCLLNNVAIAAAHALSDRGLERVMIIDWDVHHGNGTQHIFDTRPDVLFFSCHRGGGFYPGTGYLDETGAGAGRGFTVNAPLPPGCR